MASFTFQRNIFGGENVESSDKKEFRSLYLVKFCHTNQYLKWWKITNRWGDSFLPKLFKQAQ